MTESTRQAPPSSLGAGAPMSAKPPGRRPGRARRVAAVVALQAAGAAMMVGGLAVATHASSLSDGSDAAIAASAETISGLRAETKSLDAARSLLPTDTNAPRLATAAQDAAALIATKQNGLIAATGEPSLEGIPTEDPKPAPGTKAHVYTEAERLELARQAQAETRAQLKRELIPLLAAVSQDSQGFNAAAAWLDEAGLEPAAGQTWTAGTAGAVSSVSSLSPQIRVSWTLRDASGRALAVVTGDYVISTKTFDGMELTVVAQQEEGR